ncbi:luciferase-type oxidoreductase [Pseudomonas graminis]|uniref:LLM class oxidoreductase n=1 Tax=Pseudomonas graminis TaxID=158627 RepID=UPI00105BC5C7|nr:LLM class oxidoreductase [Pseudomonas graminis]TDV50250.1 luciferase-type oxidoreductase [Pseudomonas graminis]
MSSISPTEGLSSQLQLHPGYSRVFEPGHLTFGFIAPLESYPDSPGPTLQDHVAMAQKADEAGFAAIWLRDVPFWDPNFGDVGQILDPMIYAGYLAAVTRQITIGTAGIVLPLRDPLIVAKQATSVDQLLGGRFILGVATGDRPTEYPAFGIDFDSRAARFRDAFALIRTVTEQSWPRRSTEFYGQLDGAIDLVPKPVGPRIPTLVIGQSGQSLEWIGENADGILSYISNPALVAQVTERWRIACGVNGYKPYGYGTLFDLDRDPDCPVQPGRVLRAGRNALIELWKRQEELGVGHVALHFKPQRRHAAEVMDELGEYVLPHFPTRISPLHPPHGSAS